MTTNAFSALAPLTARERRTLVGLGALYAAVVVVLRIHHGGDIVPEIALSDRLLHGEPLYRADLPPSSVWWPPFAALALVPLAVLARLSLPVATAAWSVFGVGCLVVTLSVARRWTWQAVVLALLATAVPLQTNFEHRNINTVLLALVVAGAADLEDGRDRRAGMWFGLAMALKAFPGLLLVHLALRGRWRAVAAGTGAAAIGTLVPLARYGPRGAVAAAGDWLALAFDQTRWPLVAPSDQSLRALVLRLGWAPSILAVLTLLSLVALVATARRRAERDALPGVGAAILAAILVTPISWVHYFVLAFPAWVAVLAAPGAPASRIRSAALWVTGVATSGWLTVGPRPLRALLLGGSIYAWGGLVLLALVVARAFERTPIGAPTSGATR